MADTGSKLKYVVTEGKHASMLWLALVYERSRSDLESSENCTPFWAFIKSCYICRRISNENSEPVDTTTSIVELTFETDGDNTSMTDLKVTYDDVNLGALAATNLVRTSIMYQISPATHAIINEDTQTLISNPRFQAILLACFDYNPFELFKGLEKFERIESTLIASILDPSEDDDGSRGYYFVARTDYEINNTFAKIQKQSADIDDLTAALETTALE